MSLVPGVWLLGTSGLGGTLRSMGISLVGVVLVALVLVLLYSVSVICCKVLASVLFINASGAPFVGCLSVCKMSLVALAMMLFDNAVGISVQAGNHVSVSAICSCFVLVIHVW